MKIDRKQLDLRRRVVVDHKLKRGPVYTVIHSALRMPTTEEGGCIYKQFKVSLTTNIDAIHEYANIDYKHCLFYNCHSVVLIVD